MVTIPTQLEAKMRQMTKRREREKEKEKQEKSRGERDNNKYKIISITTHESFLHRSLIRNKPT